MASSSVEKLFLSLSAGSVNFGGCEVAAVVGVAVGGAEFEDPVVAEVVVLAERDGGGDDGGGTDEKVHGHLQMKGHNNYSMMILLNSRS